MTLASEYTFWVFLPTWGAVFVGFKGYLRKSVTSIWATDVDIHTLGQCAEFWRASRKYTMAFCLLLSFLHTIARLAEMEDASAIDSSISVILLSITYALFWGFVIASPIKNLIEFKQRMSNDKNVIGSLTMGTRQKGK